MENPPCEEDSFFLLESEAAEYFSSFAQMLGYPKSIGQIYGLLFASFEPMTMGDVIEHLEISKGSASQGLNLLKELGAVRVLKVEGDRRDFYEADFDLTRIVHHFLEEKLLPRLENADERIGRMQEIVDGFELGSAVRENARGRVDALFKWQRRGRKILPFIGSLFRKK